MVQIFKGVRGLEEIRSACNELACNFASPFYRFEWLECCARTLKPSTKVVTLVSEKNGEIAAAAPLALIPGLLGSRLEFLAGTLFAGAFGGFLYSDTTSLQELVEGLLEFGLPLHLTGIRSASAESLVLESTMNRSGTRFLVKRKLVPWLPITGSWEYFKRNSPFLEEYSSPRTSKEKHFCRDVFVEFVSPSADDVDDPSFPLDSFLKLSRGSTIDGSAGKSGVRDFIKDYLRLTAAKGFLKIGILKKEARAMAMIVALEYSERLWEIMVLGSPTNWNRVAEKILCCEFIRHSFKSGLEAVEFLEKDSTNLKSFTQHVHDMSTYIATPGEGGGIFALGREFTRDTIEEVHKGISRAVKRI